MKLLLRDKMQLWPRSVLLFVIVGETVKIAHTCGTSFPDACRALLASSRLNGRMIGIERDPQPQLLRGQLTPQWAHDRDRTRPTAAVAAWPAHASMGA